MLGAETGVAHADTWMIQGAKVTSELKPTVQTKEVEEISGKKERYVAMASEILKVKMEVRCTGIELTGAKLEVGGAITTGSKARFTGCIMFVNGKLTPACEPHTKAEKGVIVTKELMGSLVSGVLHLKPVSGEILKVFEMSEECAVGEQIPILGTLSLKEGSGEIANERITHLLEEAPETAMWVISKTLEHEITLFGSAVMELSGVHKGLTWSGHNP